MPRLQKSAPQASGPASLFMKQVFVYESVCLTTPRELHKASIADHMCILFVIDQPFKPHFFSPSCILPSSPSARPAGMHEAVEWEIHPAVNSETDADSVYNDDITLRKHLFSMNSASTPLCETLEEDIHPIDSENNHESVYD